MGRDNEHSKALDAASICNIVRKWNTRFDGHRDPTSFLERVEELIIAYEIDRDLILKALPEMLTGTALLWYRNFRETWTTYEMFRRSFELQFLPPGYRRNLDEQIRLRTQGDSEPFRSFTVALTTLMRRRGGLSRQEELDRIYSNMKPEYKLTIKRHEVYSMDQLLEQAEHVESCNRERAMFRPPPPPSMSLVPETAYYQKKRGDKYSNRVEIGALDRAVKFDDAGVRSPTRHVRFQDQGSPGAYPEGPRKNHGKTRATNAEFRHAMNRREGDDDVVGNNTSYPTDRKDNSRAVCWNCDKQGHFYRQCRAPKIMRCFHCKTLGVKTHECACQQGNDPRAQAGGSRLSPH